MNVAHVQVIFWIFFDIYEYSVFMYPYFSTKQIRVLSRLRVGVPCTTDILPTYIYAFEFLVSSLFLPRSRAAEV